jgi:hypothetical protein
VIIILFNHDRPSYEFGYLVGGLLVLGGLLLRIEAAVRAGSTAGAVRELPDDQARL